MHAPMYCDHRICMYYDHRICMYYDHGTCTPSVHKSYDSNPCQWSAPDWMDFSYPMPSIAPRHHASQQSWSNAWYIWKSENKVVISRGRGAHRCHHARTKSILILKSEGPMLRFAWFLGGPETWEPVKINVFWPKKCIQNVIHVKKLQKSYGFAREVRTSMSPRCSEIATCFEK